MAQKMWSLYSNTGSFNDGTIWFLINGSTPGGTAGVPASSDYVFLTNQSTTGQTRSYTGSLGAQTIEIDTGPSLVLNNASVTSAEWLIYTAGGLTMNGGTLTQTDGNNAINLYGGVLNLNGTTVNAYGIYEGVMSGGNLVATNNSHLNFSGAPNGITTGGLVGLTVKQTALIDHSVVSSANGLIGVGDGDPAANATLTIQNNSQVTALYTYIGSGNSTSGAVSVLGAGTTLANVGAVSTTNDSGYTVVGGSNSLDPITVPTATTATLHIGSGAAVTDLGGRVGNQVNTIGIATVDGGASWTSSGAIRVGQYGTGTLFVGAGSIVQSTGPHVLATSSFSFGNFAGSLGVGTVSGAGARLSTGGDRLTIGNSGRGGLTVSAGGYVLTGASYTDTEAALAVGASVGGAGGLMITDAGSAVVAVGQVMVGGNNTGAGAVAGGTGTVSAVLGGALYSQNGLTLFSGGTLITDGTGLIDIGGSGGKAGTTTVEAKTTLVDLGGMIKGTLSGAGTVQVSGFDTVDNSAGGLTFQFGAAHSTLALSAQSGGSALVNFTQGDVLEFVKQNVTPTLTGNILSAGGAAFGLYGAPVGTHLVTTHDAAGDTLVTASTAGDDFNNDGRSDLLLQNDNGQIDVFYQSNLALTGGSVVGNAGASYHVVGTGDFNGDGNLDLLVQNTNGTVVDYFMNGAGAITGGAVLGSPGAGWHVRGVADFNNDGKADVVLQNDDSTMVIWTTNGTSVTGGAVLGKPGAGWTVQAVGDFNGDGQPDVVVQNTNGNLVDYTMSGLAIASGAALANPGPGWYVDGTGVDATGHNSLLLHNDSGQDIVWSTNGTSITAGSVVATPGAGYTGAVAGLDLNGDGNTDVVLQNTNSTLVGYTLDANQNYTGGAALVTPGAGWHAIGNTPMEFIDGTGANNMLTATVGPDQFDFTSFATGYHQISGFDPATDSIALSAATFGSFVGVQIQPYQTGSTYVRLNDTSSLVLLGVTPSQISASDFVFR